MSPSEGNLANIHLEELRTSMKHLYETIDTNAPGGTVGFTASLRTLS